MKRMISVPICPFCGYGHARVELAFEPVAPFKTPGEFYGQIEAAKAALAKLTPEQQREMWEAQRQSWARQDKD